MIAGPQAVVLAGIDMIAVPIAPAKAARKLFGADPSTAEFMAAAPDARRGILRHLASTGGVIWQACWSGARPTRSFIWLTGLWWWSGKR